ncbi:LysE family translocator [Ideonella sp.]|uniref:LysE family translocator n=1 Tax=Ideonella sp. TaxID=1929293 RepID=UPI0035B07A13
MNIELSMAAFALVASATPGPVNLVALSSGARHGWRSSLPYVAGATVGFTALLVLVGLGLQQAARALPMLMQGMRWAGVLFLLYMAFRLLLDSGEIGQSKKPDRRPSMWAGAAMQWLNPKAWLASVSGIAVYAADGDMARVWLFAAIYFAICFASVGAWAVAGSAVSSMLTNARTMRRFNALMAGLLAISAVVMLWH